jgi:hypothetical protein
VYLSTEPFVCVTSACAAGSASRTSQARSPLVAHRIVSGPSLTRRRKVLSAVIGGTKSKVSLVVRP